MQRQDSRHRRERQDTRRSEAAYQTIAQDLRGMASGANGTDERLPTEAELVLKYGVSRQTIRRAMQELASEGLIYRVPGRGTFPVKRDRGYIRQFGSVDDLMALSLDTELQFATKLQRNVNVEAAGRLRLKSDSVLTVAFIRMHEGVPFCFTTVWIPPKFSELLADLAGKVQPGEKSKITFIGFLDGRMPTRISQAEQSITAVAMPDDVAKVLGSPSGEPALRIDRLYLDPDDEPVELAISYFVPSYYSYRVHLRRS